VDGFRPDIVAVKVVKALAALDGRKTATRDDVILSLGLALGHRTRSSGMIPPPTPVEIRKVLGKADRKERKKRLGDTTKTIGRVIELSKETAISIKRIILRKFVFSLILLTMIIISFIYILENLRKVVSPIPPTPIILAIEGLIGYALLLIIQRILKPKNQGKRIPLATFDLSNMLLNVKEKIQPIDEGSGVGGGISSTEVRYEEGFTTTPDFGLKILESMESFYEGKELKEKIRKHTPQKGRYSGRRRVRTLSSSTKGRSAWYRLPIGKPKDIALVPTMKVAALHQLKREKRRFPRLVIKSQDIRVKVREYYAPLSIILLVDMSMSMIGSIKNLIQGIYSLHRNVYRKKDRVGLIVFKGSRAFTIQHPTANLNLVVKKLREVGASDFTPLATGLMEAWKVLKQEKLRNRNAIFNLVVFSDGITNVPLARPLSFLTRRKYHSEAQADAIDVAHLIAKDKIKVYIINTNHIEQDLASFPMKSEGLRVGLTPTQFLMELSRVSKGSYQGLKQFEEAF
jgi:Mg-chelatase subunit ChlD